LQITGIGVAMALVFFVISFLVGYFWIDSILFLIGVVVSCVPEGLLAIVTIGLSISARRLSSRNCIVKNLEAVETLGLFFESNIQLKDKFWF
jgi:sodium/potassium-transporting ATPase subunit alpha